MNYYRRYVGDYMRDTMRLSMIEHGAFGQLLDIQYATEKPLPADYDALYRMCRAMSRAEQDAIRKVADEFFPLCDGGRFNPRAARELKVAQSTIAKQRESGVDSARKRWSTDGSTHKLTDGSTDAASIQPPTTNHQPPAASHQPPTAQPPENSTAMSSTLDPPPAKSLNGYRQQAAEVMQWWNEKHGRNFPLVDATLMLVSARLKEGATVADCRSVIAKKHRDWSGDPKMAPYLRPKTIFNATNFANYKGELIQVPHE